MALKIEKGIPFPEPTSVASELGRFEIGDSAFIEVASGKVPYSTVYNYATRTGKTFKVRTTVENGVRGIRVWRVA